MLDAEPFMRENYRGHRLPTAGGLLIVWAFAGLLVTNVFAREVRDVLTASRGQRWDALLVFGPATLFIALGFAFVGLIDDMGGTGQSGGFRGHVSALLHGRMTTGALKMIGGPLLAMIVLSEAGVSSGRGGVLRDTVVVSLAANLGNLLDRAPGRTNKVAQLALLVMILVDRTRALVPVAAFGGAALALMPRDLREQVMLGDTGSNALGATMGFGLVLVADPSSRWWACGVLVALNLGSEFVSYSRVIDAISPLRHLDRLGSPYRTP
jgi:UDP-N-acetylmuramyl pentapeptide phosphotransferase/UDP-N-acetylglucosamine-1-phosphate transferase